MILEGADRPAAGTGEASSEAAASVRAAVRRINELLRKISRRDGGESERIGRG